VALKWRLAIAIVVLAIAAALGAVAAGQSRDPAAMPHRRPLRPDPRGPSPIVYPPQRIAIRMNHAHPAHRALRCVRCHENAATSASSRDLLIPREQACVECHAGAIDRDGPHTAERCGQCHAGFETDSDVVPASEFPAPRLHFSHRTHVARGMRCLSCHRGVDRATLADRRHLPTMRQCFECHGPPGMALEASAPSTCETCHLAQPDGRLRTRFAEGTMNPPTWLFDMRHDHEWLVRHRWVGADQGSRCATCHAESDCSDCHDGMVRPLRVHPGDYLSTHVVQARRDEPRCSSCHQVSRFCGECHSRLGLSTMSAPDVRSTARYHPPNAVWVRGPVMHAREAERSMNACASCHAEDDCVNCHGALGIGAGVSPHPPGFAAGCAQLLEANDRACRTCHGDVDALRARCR
jgi:hypothetical protein